MCGVETIFCVVQGWGKRYGDKQIFEDVNLEVYRQDVVGIIGPNGVGKDDVVPNDPGERTANFGGAEGWSQSPFWVFTTRNLQDLT